MGKMKDLAIELMEREEEDARILQQADEYAASLEYQAACEEAEQYEAERARLGMTD